MAEYTRRNLKKQTWISGDENEYCQQLAFRLASMLS